MAPARGRALRPSQSCFTLLCQIQARNPASQMEARKTVEICPLLNRTLNVVELFPLLSGTRKSRRWVEISDGLLRITPAGMSLHD